MGGLALQVSDAMHALVRPAGCGVWSVLGSVCSLTLLTVVLWSALSMCVMTPKVLWPKPSCVSRDALVVRFCPFSGQPSTTLSVLVGCPKKDTHPQESFVPVRDHRNQCNGVQSQVVVDIRRSVLQS